MAGRALRRIPTPQPEWRWPVLAAAAGFLVLFWNPLVKLVRDWWAVPDAAHGLLLAPIAIGIAWHTGIRRDATPSRVLGSAILLAAVLLRYVSGVAAELFTIRMSLLGAVAGLVVYAWGFRQLLRWWLPAVLLVLSVPLPAVITGSLALPLQLEASALGAALLDARHVPVALTGNVIRLPGRALFVTEACSGLRSLTALLALGFLIGGLWLRSPWSRGVLVLAAVPVAVALNGVRIFLTGFLVFFVSPDLGDGFMHYTEGWVIFAVAFAILGAVAWGLTWIEGWRRGEP